MRASILAAVGLVGLASAAWADGVTLNGCTLDAPHSTLTCRVTNGTGAEVVWINATIEVVEPGRDQSWSVNEDEQKFLSMEPGETEVLTFRTGDIPAEAEAREIGARILSLDAFGEDGYLFRATAVPLTDPDNPMELPLPGYTRYRFEQAVLACWQKDRLSSEASRTWVSLGIDLDRQGRVMGEIRLENHPNTGEAAVQEAFDLAREAVVACLADGYELPQDMYGQWSRVRVDFNPIPMIMP